MGTSNSILAAIDAINVEVESHRAEITAIDAKIDQLLAARETLGGLVTVEEAKPVRTAQRAARSRAIEKVADELADVDVDEAVATAEAEEAAAAPRRSRRRRADSEKMTPSEAGEALVESVVKQTRRERREAKVNDSTKRSVVAAKAAARPHTLADLRKKEQAGRKTSKPAGRKTSSTNGNGGGKPNRKEQITKLLRKGQTPREVADALGIAPNYVYHVKRGL